MYNKAGSDWSWLGNYFSGPAAQKLEAVAEGKDTNPHEIQKWITLKRGWSALIREIEVNIALGAKPDSDVGKSLGQRWTALSHLFSMGNKKIEGSWATMYASRGVLPADIAALLPSDDVLAFVKMATSG